MTKDTAIRGSTFFKKLQSIPAKFCDASDASVVFVCVLGHINIEQHLYSPVVTCYHNAVGSYHKEINNNTLLF